MIKPRTEKIERLTKKIKSNHENYYNNLWDRAIYYHLIGKYEKSLEDFKKVLRLTTKNPQERTGIYLNIAELYYDMGDFKKSLKHFNKELKSGYYLDEFSLYFGKGKACLQLNRYKDALKNFKLALGLEPMSEDILTNYIERCEENVYCGGQTKKNFGG